MHFETQTIKLFVAYLFSDYDKTLYYFLKDTKFIYYHINCVKEM